MNLKHGMSRGRSPEYRAWQAMKLRCYKASDASYSRYGARGVDVCSRWADFLAFYEDVGPRPSALHSLDRIDNNKGYSPDNCRWADKTTQSRNVRPRNSFGLSGITVTKTGRFRVFISASYRTIALGTTTDFFEACCLRKNAENRYWSATSN